MGSLDILLRHMRIGKQNEDKEKTIPDVQHLILLLYFIFYLRVNIADAKNNGEKCAKLRIIELAETAICNVICIPPTPAPAPSMYS